MVKLSDQNHIRYSLKEGFLELLNTKLAKKDFVNSFQTVQWFSLVYILNEYFGTRSREII